MHHTPFTNSNDSTDVQCCVKVMNSDALWELAYLETRGVTGRISVLITAMKWDVVGIEA